MRLRLDVAYDGSDFHGWATQPDLRTVQGELEGALSRVLRLDAAPVTCAGRTDTGVHARGQVVHLDLEPTVLDAAAGRSTATPTEALCRRLNGVLPPDVRVRGVREVPPAFDARFSATWRRYAYRVADRPGALDPLTRSHVLAWPRQLDLEAMNAGAHGLVGEHDFAAFCKRREGATTIRRLTAFAWHRAEDGTAVAHVQADAFCHHMVRSLVGCLLAVGEGRRPADWPAQVLARRERDPAVTVVHAHGLTLEEVGYPPDDQLAAQAAAARRVRTLLESEGVL
ncbi:tRNA pseudouridine(38-40) synthase TruA [Nocardioides massiliensis]|uniref:tRNA pseudouridine synthase A n=1 Tax=Nocardioides massiliensis TaxID=1325935 RepID=A0ABT9NPP9_9ACTN|nr:tRNA pseudouridine(38-40) synthase TruA [Nocardioides massiliensis]MDP9822045.1 tRNA pseudouridine38-40 synthase [Nocardioides massiliensis]